MSSFWIIVGIIYFFIGLITLAACAGKYNGQQTTVVGVFHCIVLFMLWIFYRISLVGSSRSKAVESVPSRPTRSLWDVIGSWISNVGSQLDTLLSLGFWPFCGIIVCALICAVGFFFGGMITFPQLIAKGVNPDVRLDGNALVAGLVIMFGSVAVCTIGITLIVITNVK